MKFWFTQHEVMEIDSGKARIAVWAVWCLHTYAVQPPLGPVLPSTILDSCQQDDTYFQIMQKSR